MKTKFTAMLFGARLSAPKLVIPVFAYRIALVINAVVQLAYASPWLLLLWGCLTLRVTVASNRGNSEFAIVQNPTIRMGISYIAAVSGVIILFWRVIT